MIIFCRWYLTSEVISNFPFKPLKLLTLYGISALINNPMSNTSSSGAMSVFPIMGGGVLVKFSLANFC
jgi:hypothetical protein